MKQKDKFIFYGILIVVAFILLKSAVQFVFWYYPKNCVFFELDFSKQCASENWSYVINGNIDKTKEAVEEGVNNYIEHKQDKIERRLENIQNNVNSIEIETNVSSGGLDLEVINK